MELAQTLLETIERMRQTGMGMVSLGLAIAVGAAATPSIVGWCRRTFTAAPRPRHPPIDRNQTYADVLATRQTRS